MPLHIKGVLWGIMNSLEENLPLFRSHRDSLMLWTAFYIVLNFVCRYKVTCQETWPTYKGEARDGVSRIIAKFGFQKDVTYGKTKIFIRTPKTLFALEDERQKKLPTVVIFLQKVSCDLYKDLSNLFCIVPFYVTSTGSVPWFSKF